MREEINTITIAEDNTVPEEEGIISKDISSMFVVTHKDTTMGYDKQLLVIKGKDRISYVQ